jgi:hypothetical protein
MREPFFRFRQDPAAPDPCALLGLPAPGDASLNDPDLARLYAEFCGHLAADPRGRFVRAEGLVFWDRWTQRLDDRFAALRLLAALYHPNSTQVRAIQRRLGDFIRYRNRRGQFEGHVFDHDVLRCFQTFRDAPDHADFAALTGHTCTARTLGRLADEHAAGPGFTFFAEVHVSRYSDRWAVVLFFGDAENDPYEAFPCVLGFVRTDDVTRNTARLLDPEDLFLAPQPFIIRHGLGELAAVGWFGGEDDPQCGAFLAQFTDRELAILRQETGSLLDVGFQDLAASIASELDPTDRERVVARFGPPRGPGYLRDLEERLLG